MITIANNITTRDREVEQIFHQRETDSEKASSNLGNMAQRCITAGADIIEINLQQHHDCAEAMEFAIKSIQQVTDHQLCLSANNSEALESGLRLCRRPPVVNYIGIDTTRLENFLPLAAKYEAEIILLVSEPAYAGDAGVMMKKAAVLVGAANQAGIPNEHILVDPGLIHIAHEAGQAHFVQAMEFLRALPDVFEPPVRSTCWLGNSSANVPHHLRPLIETTVLSMLSSLGLSSIFLDVLQKEYMKTVFLLKVLHNETVYADAMLENI